MQFAERTLKPDAGRVKQGGAALHSRPSCRLDGVLPDGKVAQRCCDAAFQFDLCLLRVIHVGSRLARLCLYVRCTSDSDQTGASQRSDALCHEETHAPLFNPLEVRARTVATLHSIAVASAEISGGISKLRALAVFRLIINSNRVACSIGRSAGLLPLRILSTNAPALRQICGKSTP
jgi:hypothetical protein